MSGVAVVRYLLSHNAPVLSIVPASRIVGGDLPANFVMPAISVKQISSVERQTLAMTEAPRLNRDRVQVSVLFKSQLASPQGVGYPGIRSTIRLVRAALPNMRAVVNGIEVDSILPDTEGPDLSDDVTGILSTSRDFIVSWLA